MIGVLLRNRYEVTDVVDESAIFLVYRAKDRLTGREFMVRLLKSPFDREPVFHEELKEIVKELSVISSPLVERLVDVDEYEGIIYVLSEAKSGQKLSERIRKLAPYTVPVAVSMTLQILEAVHSVNSQGFAHGEITSDHILVNNDGKLFLLQPGLWVAYGASSTAGKAILPGLAPYLAPEVFEGRMMPSPTSDVYGVGIVLFELLTGRLPFQSDSPAGYLQKHLTAPIPNVRQYNQSVPTFIEEFIKKAMSKHPQHRYTNARSMMSDLRMIQDALRFGRHLEWPIKGSESIAASPAIAPKGALPPNYFDPTVTIETTDGAVEPIVAEVSPLPVDGIESPAFVPTVSEEAFGPTVAIIGNSSAAPEIAVPVSAETNIDSFANSKDRDALGNVANDHSSSFSPETTPGHTEIKEELPHNEEQPWPSRPQESYAKADANSAGGQGVKKSGGLSEPRKDWKPKPQPIKTVAKPDSPNRRTKEYDDFGDKMPKWASVLTFIAVCIIVLVISGGLFFFNSKPSVLKVPNLVGSTVSDAQQKFNDMGLILQVSRKEYSENKPDGTILELNPRPGGDVKQKGVVRAIVSSGSKFISVPDLRGMTEQEAIDALSGLDLELSKPINEVRSTRLKAGQIVNQIPNKTSRVERGTKVRVEVAAARTRTRDNATRVRAEYEIAIRIPQDNDPVKVRVDIVDAEGTRTIYDDQQHQPGDEFFINAEGVGDEIYFKIFYDGILISQKSVKPEELINR